MRESARSKFMSFDGAEINFKIWEPVNPQSKKALILIHRGHEHSGRLQTLVDGLGLNDFWAFAFDLRGHGENQGPRGYAPDFSYFVRDLDEFANLICRDYGIAMEDISVVANSVGAVVAATWLHDYAPRIRSIVMAAPAFEVKLYVPFALPGLRLLNKIKHPSFISSYVKSKMLTHDPEESKKYDEDKLITREIAVNILIGLFDNAQRVVADAQAIQTPTLILSAGRDFVVKLSAQRRFFENLGSTFKKLHLFPKFFHGVLYEKDKEDAFNQARQFILESFKIPVETSYLVRSDMAGPTHKEFMNFMRPANILKSAIFGFQRLMMTTLGRLSRGISLGLSSGFNSGLTLDYVYENKPQGKALIGRLIDKTYLDSLGWRGIRIRKKNLEQMLQSAIDHLTSQGEIIRILDIGGGPARYLQDVLERNLGKDIKAVVRDFSADNVLAGQQRADQKKLYHLTYEVMDAFNEKNYENLPYQPNIVIISGLLELYSDNEKVLKAIRGIASVVPASGFVIYTGQPWHPQLEMIARTLNGYDQQPWVMRRRTQAELDELFRSQGLEKRLMQIDQYGIFTVSMATKRYQLAKTVTVASTREISSGAEINA